MAQRNQFQFRSWRELLTRRAMNYLRHWFTAFVVALVLGCLSSSLSLAQLDEADALSKRVSELFQVGKYAEAIPLAQRALAIELKVLGPEHPHVAASLNTLAELYRNQGRYTEAEPLLKLALMILEKALGSEHPDVALSLNNLAELYRNLARYVEAEPLYIRSLAIREKLFGPNHPNVASSLNNLAALYHNMGRYADAEQLYKRALVIREKTLGQDHITVAFTLNNLAELYRVQDRYAEAEPLYKRSLAIREKVYGPNHPSIATALNNLALLYFRQERYQDAEPLIKRAIAIDEGVLGQDHPKVAMSLNNLAELYRNQGRYADAEGLYKRALVIFTKALGADHPDVAVWMNNLASLYDSLGRYSDAEQSYKRALEIWEKAFGPDYPNVAILLNNLAELYRNQRRYSDAEPLYKRALAVREKLLGPDHPSITLPLNNLALLYGALSDWPNALKQLRRASDIITRQGSIPAEDRTGLDKQSVADNRFAFRLHVLAIARVLTSEATGREESFRMAQWALQTEAAAALNQMAVRFAAGPNTELANLVRERQDLLRERKRVDELLLLALGKNDSQAVAQERNAYTMINARLDSIAASVKQEFPTFVEMSNPQPLTIIETQALLNSDEALIQFLDVPSIAGLPAGTFAWVVTKGQAQWFELPVSPHEITAKVQALRCGLDQTLWYDDVSSKACRELIKIAPVMELTNEGMGQVLPFDAGRAYELYKALLAPAEGLIAGKHLLIVPSGALTSLPFNVLVTAPTKTAIPAKLADYRGIVWLGTRQPLTVLPSVSSLKALRESAKTSRASKPYLGIGNPLLDGPPGDADARQKARQAQQRKCSEQPVPFKRLAENRSRGPESFTALFRGDHANIEQLRLLMPLPETSDELCAVGLELGAGANDILLGIRATESEIKRLSEQGELAKYQTLHFATHGALSGQVQGSAEPGLILTPPPKDTTDAKLLERDDGYLTTSEIATLTLDADWVILSACNTAGASGQTAEALSGMARAFFYAGARTLLVSHWEVGSDAAVKLTTRAFAALKAKPDIGRDEAFRLSMRELIEQGALYQAHPSQWAPFVVVGEPGKRSN